LYNAIANKRFPSWSFKVQIMTYAQAEKFKWNPFDLTKIWPQSQFPLIDVGKIVLDRNPSNYFAEVEQIGFSPANFVPGIEASPDKMLQGRLFAYDDTHRHRLGANFHALPVNRAVCPLRGITQRDGPYTYDDNQGGTPNYYPNSFSHVKHNPVYKEHKEPNVSGDVDRHDSSNDDNFEQASNFWNKVLKPEERERLVSNIAGHLKDALPFIRERAVGNFEKVSAEFGSKLQAALKQHSQNGASRL
jgi:catalase